MKKDLSGRFRAEFVRMTLDTMAPLHDVNIANLLGSVDESPGRDAAVSLHWFVFEHLPLGDLKQFLRRHRLVSTTTSAAEPSDNTIRSVRRRPAPGDILSSCHRLMARV